MQTLPTVDPEWIVMTWMRRAPRAAGRAPGAPLGLSNRAVRVFLVGLSYFTARRVHRG